MGASSGVRSPAVRMSSVTRAIEVARAELQDPAMTALAIATLTLVTFTLVRIGGGAPSALMELGYVPVALAAWAFGSRGGLAAGICVGAALGPIPSLLGFDRVEGPLDWIIRAAAFAAVGALVGRGVERTESGGGVVRARLVEVAERERQSLLALAKAAESRDTDTGEHVQRLELTSRRLAEAAGLDSVAAVEVGWAAMLHDLGKLQVPERILMKPEPLDADEWNIVRLHPIWGEQALAGGERLAVARAVARWHHENWDGSGYPDGLYGDRIPLAARIVRITDAFDAMTNKRPYQQPVSFEAALEEIKANAGHDFDPDLVGPFIELIRTHPDLRSELTDLRLI